MDDEIIVMVQGRVPIDSIVDAIIQSSGSPLDLMKAIDRRVADADFSMAMYEWYWRELKKDVVAHMDDEELDGLRGKEEYRGMLP